MGQATRATMESSSPEIERAVVNTWRAAARLAETESWAVVGAERTHLLKLSALFRRIADRKE